MIGDFRQHRVPCQLHSVIIAYIAGGEFEVDNSDAVWDFEKQVRFGGEAEGFVLEPNAEAAMGGFKTVGLEAAAHFEIFD